MPDRKFTVVNGSKTPSAPTPKKVFHAKDWLLAFALICVCIMLVGLALALSNKSRVSKTQNKKQTTCLTWEDQGQTQVQCGGKLYVEKTNG